MTDFAEVFSSGIHRLVDELSESDTWQKVELLLFGCQ